MIDGYHRLIAHKIEEQDPIKSVVEDLPREEVYW